MWSNWFLSVIILNWLLSSVCGFPLTCWDIYSLPKVRHDRNAARLSLVSAVFWPQLVLRNEFLIQHFSNLFPKTVLHLFLFPPCPFFALYLCLFLSFLSVNSFSPSLTGFICLPAPIVMSSDIQSWLEMCLLATPLPWGEKWIELAKVYSIYLLYCTNAQSKMTPPWSDECKCLENWCNFVWYAAVKHLLPK